MTAKPAAKLRQSPYCTPIYKGGVCARRRCTWPTADGPHGPAPCQFQVNQGPDHLGTERRRLRPGPAPGHRRASPATTSAWDHRRDVRPADHGSLVHCAQLHGRMSHGSPGHHWALGTGQAEAVCHAGDPGQDTSDCPVAQRDRDLIARSFDQYHLVLALPGMMHRLGTEYGGVPAEDAGADAPYAGLQAQLRIAHGTLLPPADENVPWLNQAVRVPGSRHRRLRRGFRC